MEEEKEIIQEITLTEDQKQAYDALIKWLEKPITEAQNDCFFALTGSAGTGKTTLVKSFIDGFNYYYKSRYTVSAPTHKARKILELKSGAPDSKTVQSLLGLKLDVNIENFDVAFPEFSPIGTKAMSEFKLVIIDESSMVNPALYATIREDAINYKTKVLFIGDLKQLPFIKKKDYKQDIKDVLNEEFLSPTLLEPKNKYNLTQVVRQSNGNPLIELFDILGNDIQNDTDEYKNYLSNNPIQVNDKGEGYEVLNATGFGAKLSEYFQSTKFKEDRNYLRYIAYTNKAIKDGNHYIRDKALNHFQPIIEGELLLGYKTILVGDKHNQSTLISNSEDYQVSKVEDVTDSLGIRVLVTKMKSVDNNFETIVNIVYPDLNNIKKFYDLHQDYLETAIAKRGTHWVKYYQFKNNYLLLDDITQGKKVVVKKDIDYGYGITIHKSQGSTFDTVFLNGKDVDVNFNPVERRRLWYVALSRASHKAYINL